MAIELASTEGLPEFLSDAVIEQDGKFLLDETKIKTQKDLDTYKTALEKRTEERIQKEMARFKNIDPDKYQDLMQELEQHRTKDIDPEKLEKALSSKLGPLQARLQETEEALKVYREKAESYEKETKRNAIASALRKSVGDSVACEAAFEDLQRRADGVFDLADDGKPYGPDGLKPESWILKLKETAPHLFKPTQGAGAGGGKGGINNKPSGPPEWLKSATGQH